MRSVIQEILLPANLGIRALSIAVGMHDDHVADIVTGKKPTTLLFEQRLEALRPALTQRFVDIGPSWLGTTIAPEAIPATHIKWRVLKDNDLQIQGSAAAKFSQLRRQFDAFRRTALRKNLQYRVAGEGVVEWFMVKEMVNNLGFQIQEIYLAPNEAREMLWVWNPLNLRRPKGRPEKG